MLLHRGRFFRDAEGWVSKKRRKMLKNCQKCQKNGGKMAIWLGIIVFITYFNTYGTDTNTRGKTFGRNWNLEFEKNVEMIKMMKMSKNGQKCRKNVNKIGFDYI